LFEGSCRIACQDAPAEVVRASFSDALRRIKRFVGKDVGAGAVSGEVQDVVNGHRQECLVLVGNA